MVLFPDFLPVLSPPKKNDEPWLSEADHRRGWNKEFKNKTSRGMLYRTFLRDYPKQVKSLAKPKSVPANMREFLSLGHRDMAALTLTASTVERTNRRAGICWSAPRSMQGFFSQWSECAFQQVDVRNLWYRSKGRASSSTTGASHMFSPTHGPHGKQRTRERHVVSIVEPTLILFRVTITKQHLRIVMKILQIVCCKTRRSRNDNLILRHG